MYCFLEFSGSTLMGTAAYRKSQIRRRRYYIMNSRVCGYIQKEGDFKF